MTIRHYSFAGGEQGLWRVVAQKAVAGEPLPSVARLDVSHAGTPTAKYSWILKGIISNERYVEHNERALLVAKQEGLDRPQATCAALLPIRKSGAWWMLTQDERRAVFETRSRHIQIGLSYLPAIARRLYHCRDLSEHEPFDFLTWFEFAPTDEAAFDRLLTELRASEEWKYVERESEFRLIRDAA